MPKLTNLEKAELMLIGIVLLILTMLHTKLPTTFAVGSLITSLALTVLLQGFLRDLYLLYRKRRNPDTQPKVVMRCMCLESTLGLPLVILGVTIAVILPEWKFELPSILTATLHGVALISGFLIKDLLVIWRPLGLRREKNHSHITFRL